MNPNPLHDDSAAGTACPKRLWVMMELADDESRTAENAPATGLRFHLSRCPSCRALAERMEAVRTELAAMAAAEPDDDLQIRAESRVLAGLGGLADSATAFTDDEPAPHIVKRRPGRWLRRSVAAAAALGLIACGWMLRALIVEPDRLVAPNSFDRWYIPDAEFASNRDALVIALPLPPPLDSPVNSSDAAALATVADNHDSLIICRFRNHEDAALWDHPGCAPAAMILPGPPDRPARSTFSIDNSTRTLSTGPASQRR